MTTTIRAVAITVSDRCARGEQDDLSGRVLVELLRDAGAEIVAHEVLALAEAMRADSLKHTPMAMISRGVCGIRSGTLIINLPGSPKGVRESFAVIAPVLNHAIALLAGHPHDQAQ